MAQLHKQQSYDLSYKLKAVKVVLETSKEEAARKFKIAPKWISEWCDQSLKKW
jgi:hypothetical protein